MVSNTYSQFLCVCVCVLRILGIFIFRCFWQTYSVGIFSMPMSKHSHLLKPHRRPALMSSFSACDCAVILHLKFLSPACLVSRNCAWLFEALGTKRMGGGEEAMPLNWSYDKVIKIQGTRRVQSFPPLVLSIFSVCVLFGLPMVCVGDIRDLNVKRWLTN